MSSTTSSTQKPHGEQHRPYIFINSNDPINPNKLISSTNDGNSGDHESSAKPFFQLPFPPKFSLEDLLQSRAASSSPYKKSSSHQQKENNEKSLTSSQLDDKINNSPNSMSETINENVESLLLSEFSSSTSSINCPLLSPNFIIPSINKNLIEDEKEPKELNNNNLNI
ncbi:8731_t:CDS:2, partial [Ambispora leptoticha]